MENRPKRSWRRRILTALAVLIGAIAVPVIVLNIIFALHAVKPAQRQPPKEWLHVKPAPRAKTDAPTTATLPAFLAGNDKIPDSIKAFLAAHPNREAARLYAKLDGELSTNTVTDLFTNGLFMTPDRMSPKTVEWMNSHRAVIDDIFKLAQEGGIPTVSNEAAAALDAQAVMKIPIANLLLARVMGRIMATECRLRRERGDFSGAAECILANEKLAQSVGEPLIINMLVSVEAKNISYKELGVWIEKSPLPADATRKLRDELENVPAIDFRPSAELEYRSGRAGLVEFLSGSYRDIVRFRLGHYYRSMDFYSWTDEMRSAPGQTLERTADAGFVAARIKASADSILSDYDTYFKKSYEMLAPGRPVEQYAESEKFVDSSSLRIVGGWWTPSYTQMKTRGAVVEAALQLDLAGLDRVIEPTSDTVKRIDPFTNAPLRKSDATSHALIYSLGPDREDQHGAVTYDPTNGTYSAGDILLRARRP